MSGREERKRQRASEENRSLILRSSQAMVEGWRKGEITLADCEQPAMRTLLKLAEESDDERVRCQAASVLLTLASKERQAKAPLQVNVDHYAHQTDEEVKGRLKELRAEIDATLVDGSALED